MNKFIFLLVITMGISNLYSQDLIKLVPSSMDNGSYFGHSVSISGDNIAVGSPLEYSSKGAVHIFSLNNGTWAESQVLTIAVGEEEDYFGYAVELLGDVLVASAIGRAQGQVFIYNNNNDVWELDVILEGTVGSDYALFGESMYLTYDYLLIGETKGFDGIGSYEGYAFVFEREQNGVFRFRNWVNTYSNNDFSGTVSLAAYGHDILMGAYKEGVDDLGAAYYFERDGNHWVTKGHFLPDSTNLNGGYFGRAVEMNDQFLIVGYPSFNGNRGGVYILNRLGTVLQLISSINFPDGANLGSSMDLDGSYLIIGSRPASSNVGQALIYKYYNNQFNLEKSLSSPSNGRFGSSVAVDNNNFVIGSWNDFGEDGETYVYQDRPVSIIESSYIVPIDFNLNQNYPNPFNPTTTIEYELASPEFVRLEMYNLLGQVVKILVKEEQITGKYMVKLDAAELPSGVYFYSIQAGNFKDTKKLLLLK
jgi:hypothetical protein